MEDSKYSIEIYTLIKKKLNSIKAKAPSKIEGANY